jgi:hypothetical protein
MKDQSVSVAWTSRWESMDSLIPDTVRLSSVRSFLRSRSPGVDIFKNLSGISLNLDSTLKIELMLLRPRRIVEGRRGQGLRLLGAQHVKDHFGFSQHVEAVVGDLEPLTASVGPFSLPRFALAVR